MRFQSLTILASVAAVAAESTVTLFLPGFYDGSYVASIASTEGPMTAYALSCPAGADSNDCGLPPDGLTVLQGSTSMAFSATYENEHGCKFEGTSLATCVALQSGSFTSVATTITINPTMLGNGGGFLPVVVTATNTAALSASTGASPSATTATETGVSTTATSFVVSSTPTDSASTTLSTATSSSSPQTTGADAEQSPTPTSNLALPQVTGNARWAAGAAIAAALVAF
ncbi:hypothetical protein MW887_000204 [Aspergillus wentii]|nr:hypothetical protein MW887_000204 [Aspergillus wentii]